MKRSTIISAVVAASVTALSFAATAQAKDHNATAVNPAGHKQLRVNTSDLDLASEAGTRELRNRVRAAASQVCEGVDRSYGRDMPVNFGECFQTTVRTAMQQLTVTGRRPDATVVSVSYSDLSLATPGSASVLRDRVKRAVTRNCRDTYPNAISQSSACARAANVIARPQIAAAVARARAGQSADAGNFIRLRFAGQ
jgi:UrcA family protein